MVFAIISSNANANSMILEQPKTTTMQLQPSKLALGRAIGSRWGSKRGEINLLGSQAALIYADVQFLSLFVIKIESYYETDCILYLI